MAAPVAPPKRSRTRLVFLWIIGLTVVAMGAALTVGPWLAADASRDPRGFVALLPILTAAALVIGVLWFIRMTRNARRDGR